MSHDSCSLVINVNTLEELSVFFLTAELKEEAAGSYKNSPYTIPHNMPADHNLSIHHHKQLKSHFIIPVCKHSSLASCGFVLHGAKNLWGYPNNKNASHRCFTG